MNARLNTTLQSRLSGLSLALALAMTMAMLLSVNTLATVEAQAPQMAHAGSAPQS